MVTLSEIQCQIKKLEKGNKFSHILMNDKLIQRKYLETTHCYQNLTQQTKKRSSNATRIQLDAEDYPGLNNLEAKHNMESRWRNDLNFDNLSNSSYLTLFEKRVAVIKHYLSQEIPKPQETFSNVRKVTKNLNYFKETLSFPTFTENTPRNWQKSLENFLNELSGRRSLFLERESFQAKEEIFNNILRIASVCANSPDFENLKTFKLSITCLIALAVSSGSLSLVLRVCVTLLRLSGKGNTQKQTFPQAELFFRILQKYKKDSVYSLPISNFKPLFKEPKLHPHEESHYYNLCTDGTYLYYQEEAKGLFKFGTGRNKTITGVEYNFSGELNKDNTSIACIKDRIYVCNNFDPKKIDVYNASDLKFVEKVELGFNPVVSSPPNCVKMFSDGIFLYVLSLEKVDSEISVKDVIETEQICDSPNSNKLLIRSRENEMSPNHASSKRKHVPMPKNICHLIHQAIERKKSRGKKITKVEIKKSGQKFDQKLTYLRDVHCLYVYQPTEITEKVNEPLHIRNFLYQEDIKKRYELAEELMKVTKGVYTINECISALQKHENSLNEAIKHIAHNKQNYQQRNNFPLVRRVVLGDENIPESIDESFPLMNGDSHKNWVVYTTGHQLITINKSQRIAKIFNVFNGALIGCRKNFCSEGTSCYDIKNDRIWTIKNEKSLQISSCKNIGPKYVNNESSLNLARQKEIHKDLSKSWKSLGKSQLESPVNQEAPITSFEENTHFQILRAIDESDLNSNIKTSAFLIAHLARISRVSKENVNFYKENDRLSLSMMKKKSKSLEKITKSVPGVREGQFLVSQFCREAPYLPFSVEIEDQTFTAFYRILKLIVLGESTLNPFKEFFLIEISKLLMRHFEILERFSRQEEKYALRKKMTKINQIEKLLIKLIFNESSGTNEKVIESLCKAYCSGVLVFHKTNSKRLLILSNLLEKCLANSTDECLLKRRCFLFEKTLWYFGKRQNLPEIILCATENGENEGDNLTYKFLTNLQLYNARFELPNLNLKTPGPQKIPPTLKFCASLLDKIIISLSWESNKKQVESSNSLETLKRNIFIFAKLILYSCSKTLENESVVKIFDAQKSKIERKTSAGQEDLVPLDVLMQNTFFMLFPTISPLLEASKVLENPLVCFELSPFLKNLGEKLKKMDCFVKGFDAAFVQKITAENRERFVFETPHPYSINQKSIVEKITIENANAVMVGIDPRSCTFSTNDVLSIYTDEKTKKNAVEVVSGNSAVYYGNKNAHKDQIPAEKTLVFMGNSLTFYFSVRNAKLSENDRSRWGFKCLVKGLNFFETPFCVDIKTTLTSLSRAICCSLISGSQRLPQEIFLKPWLVTLLGSGISSTARNMTKQMQCFISTGRGLDLIDKIYYATKYEWLCGAGDIKTGNTLEWKPAIRTMALAMLKHSGILKPLIKAGHSESARKRVRTSIIKQAKNCILEAKKLQLWMYSKAQDLNTWNNLWNSRIEGELNEAELKEDFVREYKENSDIETVESLCNLKGVAFNQDNVEESVLKLYDVMSEERGTSDSPPKNGFDQIAEYVLEMSKLLIEFRSVEEERERSRRKECDEESPKTPGGRAYSELSFKSRFLDRIREETDENANLLPMLSRSLSTPYNSISKGLLAKREKMSKLCGYLFKTKQIDSFGESNVTANDLIISLLKTNVKAEKIVSAVKEQKTRCFLRQKGFDLFRSFLNGGNLDFVKAHFIGGLVEWLTGPKSAPDRSILLNIHCVFYKNVEELAESFHKLIGEYIESIGSSSDLIKLVAMRDIFGVSYRIENIDSITKLKMTERIFQIISGPPLKLSSAKSDSDFLKNIFKEKMTVTNSPPRAELSHFNKESFLAKNFFIENSEFLDLLDMKNTVFKGENFNEFFRNSHRFGDATKIDSKSVFIEDFPRLYEKFRWAAVLIYSENLLGWRTKNLFREPHSLTKEKTVKIVQRNVIKQFFIYCKKQIIEILRMFETKGETESSPLVPEIYTKWAFCHNCLGRTLSLLLNALNDSNRDLFACSLTTKHDVNGYAAILWLILFEHNKFQPKIVRVAVSIMKELNRKVNYSQMVCEFNEIRGELGFSGTLGNITEFLMERIASLTTKGMENVLDNPKNSIFEENAEFEKESSFLENIFQMAESGLKALRKSIFNCKPKLVKEKKHMSEISRKSNGRYYSLDLARDLEMDGGLTFLKFHPDAPLLGAKTGVFPNKKTMKNLANSFSVIIHDTEEDLEKSVRSPEFKLVRSFLQIMHKKQQFSPNNTPERLTARESFRTGPKIVELSPRKEYKVKIARNGLFTTVKSEKDFVSVVANVKVKKGKWYYECVLETPGLMQIGWAKDKFTPLNNESGCGDDEHSWAYDGSRRQLWHKTSKGDSVNYGLVQWKRGDVVGCAINLNKGEGKFYLNGRSLGVAFTDLDNEHNGLFPSASFAQNQSGVFCFDPSGFKQTPPNGYYPLEGDSAFKECDPLIVRFYTTSIQKDILSHGFACLYQGCYEKCVHVANKVTASFRGNVSVVQTGNLLSPRPMKSILINGQSAAQIKSDLVDFLKFLCNANHSLKSDCIESLISPILTFEMQNLMEERSVTKLKKLLSAVTIFSNRDEVLRKGATGRVNHNGIDSEGVILDFFSQMPLAVMLIESESKHSMEKTEISKTKNDSSLKVVPNDKLRLVTSNLKFLDSWTPEKINLLVRKLLVVAKFNFDYKNIKNAEEREGEKIKREGLREVNIEWETKQNEIEILNRCKKAKEQLEKIVLMYASSESKQKLKDTFKYTLITALTAFIDETPVDNDREVDRNAKEIVLRTLLHLKKVFGEEVLAEENLPKFAALSGETLENISKFYRGDLYQKNLTEKLFERITKTFLDKEVVRSSRENKAEKIKSERAIPLKRTFLTSMKQRRIAFLTKSIQSAAKMSLSRIASQFKSKVDRSVLKEVLEFLCGDCRELSEVTDQRTLERKRHLILERMFDIRNRVDAVQNLTRFKSKGRETLCEMKESEFKSAQFVFGQSSYADGVAGSQMDNGPNRMLRYWEKNIIPRIKNYVRGSFRDYEMEYYFEQLKQPLRLRQNSRAIEITSTLSSGRIPEGIEFPQAGRDWSFLMIEDIKYGQYLIVPQTNKRKTFRFGRVERINRTEEMVQLVFFCPEKACFKEGWFKPESLKFIEEDHFYKNSSLADCNDVLDIAEAEFKLMKIEEQIGRFEARKLFKNTLDEWCSFELMQMNKLKEMFIGIARDSIELLDFERIGQPKRKTKNKKFQKDFIQMIGRIQGESPRAFLLEMFGESLRKLCESLHKSYSLTNSAGLKDKVSTGKIKIDGAEGLLLIFSVNTIIPAGNNSFIIYSDRECTNQVQSFIPTGNEELKNLPPVFIKGNRCWVKIAQERPGNVQFKLNVIPVPAHLGIALWLARLILKTFEIEGESGVGMHLLKQLIESSLLVDTPPSLVKHAILDLCSTLIYRAKTNCSIEMLRSEESQNILKGLRTCYDEMCSLYPQEAKSEFTEYFQKLADVNVITDTLRPIEQRICNSIKLKEKRNSGEEKNSAPVEDGWACANCTLINQLDSESCEVCGTEKTVAALPKIFDQSTTERTAEETFLDISALYHLGLYLRDGTPLESGCMVQFLRKEIEGEIQADDAICRFIGVRNLPRSFKGHPEIEPERVEEVIRCVLEENHINVQSVTVMDTELNSENRLGAERDKARGKPVQMSDNPFESGLPERTFNPKRPIVQNDKDFDRKGIVHFIATENSTSPYLNPVTSGKINVLSSPLHLTSGSVECFVGEKSSRCLTSGKENAFVSFEFREFEIIPTAYAVRHYESWNTESLRSWVFEGSKDGEKWIVLRKHVDDETIKKKSSVSTFLLPPTKEKFSHFRIQMTDKNSNNHWYLALSGFEIYGTLFGQLPRPEEECKESHREALIELSFQNSSKKEKAISVLESSKLYKMLESGGKLPCAKTEGFEVTREIFSARFLARKTLNRCGSPTGKFLDALLSIFGSLNKFKPKIEGEIRAFEEEAARIESKANQIRLENERAEVQMFFKKQHKSKPEMVRKSLRKRLLKSVEMKIGKIAAKNQSQSKKVKLCEENVITREIPIQPKFWEIFPIDSKKERWIPLEEILSVLSEHPLESEEAFTSLMMTITSLCSDAQTIPVTEFVASFCEFANENVEKVWDWLRGFGFDFDLTKDGLVDLDEIESVLRKKDFSARFFKRHYESVVKKGGESSAASTKLSQIKRPTREDLNKHVTSERAREENERTQISPLKTIRLQFALLKTFNGLLANLLPVVNLKRTEERFSLAGLLCSCKEFVFEKVKNDFIDAVVNLSATRTFSPPTVTMNRLAMAEKAHSGAELVFERDTHFGAAMKQLAELPPGCLRAPKPQGTEPHIAFEVNYKDQHVVGSAGPYRQFFSEISDELLSENCTAFVPIDNMAETSKRVYVLNPDARSASDLRMFETVGILIGCCVRTDVKLSLALSCVFWKKLVADDLTMKDLLHLDSALYLKLKSVMESAEEEFDSQLLRGLIQSGEFGSGEELFKERKGLGLRVARERFDRTSLQTEFVLKGIAKVVPRQILSLLTWQELEERVCGSAEIDIELLRRHTIYSQEIDPNCQVVQNFWKMLGGFDGDMRRRFVRFAWGHERLPGDDAAFERTGTRLLILEPRAFGGNNDATLPKAHTCFFNLELPSYSSLEVMTKKFTYALSQTVTMNGDDFENFTDEELLDYEEYDESE